MDIEDIYDKPSLFEIIFNVFCDVLETAGVFVIITGIIFAAYWVIFS